MQEHEQEQEQEQEQHFILHALESCDWPIIETAERLGISGKNLWEKMQRYVLSRPIDKEKL